MKTIVFAAFCLAMPAVAQAASPEDAYFTARDAAIVQISKLDDSGATGDAFQKPYDEAAGKLEQLLRPLIGPVAVKGFAGDGKLSLGSLAKGGEEFGTLDGLTFSSADEKSELIVTSDPLFHHWLVEHKTWWEAEMQNVPQTPELALKSNAFYTQAISTDAAIVRFADLPISLPDKASLAFAMLDGRTQDDTTGLAPDEIIVALMAGERLFIAVTPATAKFAAIPACAKARQAADKKVQAATDAFVASDRKNAALGDKAHKLFMDAETSLGACLSAKVKAQKGFASVVTQAQDLANAMAAGAK